MNVAIVGKNQINDVLKEKLEEEGFEPLLFDNIEDITAFSGEKTDFTLSVAGNKIKAGYVIITEEPGKEKAFDNIDLLAGTGNPVVFILDYPEESPAYLTVEALSSAIKLSNKKKQVIYLSRFMRTAGNHAESLYKDTRNAGVNFIKYQDLTLDYDKDNGMYLVEATDGYDRIMVKTHSVITADIDSANRIDKIAKVFRLKLNRNGFINEDQYFLFPSLTSRNGVYFINSASFNSSEEILEHIRFIITEIKNESRTALNNKKYAEINAAKCAFCYTCYRACPHSAMAPDYENSVMKNLKNACQACGICASVCPANAVSIAGETAKEDKAASRTIKILCCENSGKLAVDKLKIEYSELLGEIDIEPVSCGGELSVETILSSLKQYKKVLVLTCMDDACRHFEGNKRAEHYVTKVKEMLKVSGMDEYRVECSKISHALPYLLKDEIKEMINK